MTIKFSEEQFGNAAHTLNTMFIQMMATTVALRVVIKNVPAASSYVRAASMEVEDLLSPFPLTDQQISEIQKSICALAN
jgi:hypothetical protein